MKITIDSVWQKTKIEDDIVLIATLYDSYDKSSDKGEVVVLDNPKSQSYFEKMSAIGSVKNIKTLKSFVLQKILFPYDNKYFPYRNKKEEVDIYKVTINWLNLDNYSAILHDTEAHTTYGLQKQTIILKELINKEANKIKSNKFEITEKILGSYRAEVQDDGEINHEERTDYYISFVKVIRTLENSGFLKFLDIRFDFNAWPTPVQSKGALDNYYPAGQMVLFYPAEHCHVLIEIKEDNKTFVSKFTKLNSNQLNQIDSFQNKLFKISFKKTVYDPKTATLILNGTKIQIPPDTNQDYLCQVIFLNQKSMRKKWEWDEIEESEKWGNKSKNDDEEPWRKTYNAADEMNTKIAIDTGIKDFFLTKPIKTVQINPKFLP